MSEMASSANFTPPTPSEKFFPAKQTATEMSQSSNHNALDSNTGVNGNPPSSPRGAFKGEGIVNSDSPVLLHEDPFSNETSKRLFDAMDELRSCGASHDLDLPQLVIVGQQSAGKSSLLQSLTDIPFPVGDGLCTRFATRIVSRRSPPGTPDLISVSIERGETDAFGKEEDSLTRSFSPSIPSLTAAAFKDVIEKAKEVMGIQTHEGHTRKNFSSKVLKIELEGPNRSYFGILDVPGIFRAKTAGITEEEREGVEKLVTSYMKKKENFIICVVPANNDLANQEIIDLALEHAGQSRVVGVFTKCDEIPDRGIHNIVDIVKRNQQKTLENGYFVVQNQHPDAPSSDREEEENKTFSKELWLGIPTDRRGTSALKRYLANTLCKRIREVFPGMKITIKQLLAAQRDILQELGDARPEHEDRHAYFRKIARRYQTLAYQALKAPDELPSDDMKLRGIVQAAHENFAEDVTNNGHLYSFQSIEGIGYLASFAQRSSTGNHGPLYEEIRKQIWRNRGEELEGMTNPKVLKPLFNKQTSKWQALGEIHLGKIISSSTDVAFSILDHVSSELAIPEHTKNELEDIMNGFERRGHNQALKSLRAFCHDSATLPLQTQDGAFKAKVKNAQQSRFKAALERYRQAHKTEDFILSLNAEGDAGAVERARAIYSSWVVVSLTNLDGLFKEMHPRGVHNTEDEIHDILQAYYEVARTVYINHVINNIIEPLLQDPSGPLLGLSEDYIYSLSKDQVDVLGGESAHIVAMRERAEKKIVELEEALNIADRALRKTREVEAI